MSLESILPPLGGGVLIGLASLIMLAAAGRIAGISGIVGGLLSGASDSGWRWFFVGGLLLAGAGMALLFPPMFTTSMEQSPGLVIGAGLLVGFGTRLGSGCTSGHGVCGIGRLSPRSMVATATFVGAGMVSVAFFRLVLGVG